MTNLIINGQSLVVADGSSVLEAARRHGIEIPTLCDHPGLSPVGSCRLCMVEIEGWSNTAPACTTLVAEEMVIKSESPTLTTQRRAILDLLLMETQSDPLGDNHSNNEFHKWCRHYSVQRQSDLAPRFAVDSDPNPFIRVDLNECILCTRCVRACEEVQGRFVWGVAERGLDTRIIAGADTMMLDARCESCGACAAVCPTDALTNRSMFGQPVANQLVRTTCGYCGVGCQFDLNVREDRVVGVTSSPEAPVNGISLCVKGRYGYDFVHHPERLTQPLVREELLAGDESTRPHDQPRGKLVPVSWDRALGIVASRLANIERETGGDTIGLLSSAKCSNEENYLMQKLARQVLRTHNIDHCARLCHSSTVAGLAMCYGSGAMSNSMDDLVAYAASMFIIGSNTTEQHPVFGAMIRQAVLRRDVRLVVADPRTIDITEFATLHLRQKPGTDVALINGLMYLILENNWHDDEFIQCRTEGFEEFRRTVSHYNPEWVSSITGVPEVQLHEAAELIALNSPMAVIWAMGITQHTTGVLNVLSLGNLQMLLGNMGIPGGGVNPLRGQNNVQGACDMGALPNVFPGYQAVSDQKNLDKFSAAWKTGSEIDQLSTTPGLTVTEMIHQSERTSNKSATIRGIYILGENPAMTDPDCNHVRRCLESAEFVVVQEIFPSETSKFADVILPGTSFAERTGTFTNTERRVQLFNQAINPVGESRPDWEVLSELARKIMARQERRPTGQYAAWHYRSSSDIMSEIAELTPSYAGVTHQRLRQGERLQWPVLSEQHPGTPILHVDQFTRGLGKFHAVDHLPPHESPDSEYPLLLTTGRTIYHWHGGEMTRRSVGLKAVCPEPVIEISPEDARRHNVEDGQEIHIVSRRGVLVALAAVTQRVSEGLVFGNFHFPGDGNVNNLTIAALDPISKIPEYKVCAVRIEHRTNS